MRKKTLYFKTILRSYALAVLLPVAVLCVLLYDIGIVRSIEKERSNRRVSLATIADMLNQRMDECTDMAMMMSLEESLLTISPRMEVGQSIDVISRLKSYIGSRSFFDEVIIWMNDMQLLYTAEGTVYPHVLLEKRYNFSSADAAQFEQAISGNEEGIHYFSDSGTIMRIVPFPLQARTKAGHTIYVINNNTLTNILNLGITEQDCALLLYDANNHQELFKYNGLGFDVTPDMLEAIEDNRIVVDGKQCVAVTAAIPSGNWVLAWVRPNVAFLMDAQLHVVILALLVVLVISGGLIIFFTHRQYTPIQNLSTMTLFGTENELGNIYQAVVSHHEMTQLVQRQQRMLRISLIHRLLNGEPLGRDEISDMCDTLKLFSGCDVVQVVAARFLTPLTDQQRTLCTERLEKEFSDEEEVYAVSLNQESEIVLIFPGESISRIQDTLSLIEERLSRFTDQIPLLGVGSACMLNHISKGLLEARMGLENAIPQSPDNVVFYESSRNLPQMDQSFRQFEHRLSWHLRRSNIDEAKAVLENMLSSMKERHTPRQVRRYYQFRIVETIVRVVTDDSVFKDLCDSEFEQLSPLLTSTLVYSKEDEFRECAEELIRRVGIVTRRVNTLQEDRSTQNICQWVRDNIANPELSLDFLSTAQGYSSAYWSRFFKEKLSVSFNDFVWQERLKLCKQLLMETDLPVCEIVSQIGYLDSSSFIRRFRQHEGCTPGQYRSNCADAIRG